jgi:uncharacterized protein
MEKKIITVNPTVWKNRGLGWQQNKTEAVMKNKFLWITLAAILVLALGACAPAQEDGVGSANRIVPQVNAYGTGQVYVTPDVAYIYIGVHTESKDVNEALSKNNAQAQSVATALKALGVEPKDVQTTAFNVVPQQEFAPDGTPSGTKYMVDNTVYVTVHDLTNLGKMLSAVVGEGANSINGIQFDIQDKEKAQSEARKLAIQNAKAQAQEIADAAGVKLVRLLSLNVNTSNPPMPYYGGKGGVMKSDTSVPAPMAAGQLVISVDANLSYEIE